MSYRMIDAQVRLRTQELRDQAARHSGRRRAPRPGTDPAATTSELASRHPAGLRTRIGFALIEAGLRLSAGRAPRPISE